MPLLPEILRRAVRSRLPGASRTGRTDARAAPTASLYFTEPLHDLIDLSGHAVAARPVKRLTATLYACGRAAVVIRYAGPAELAALKQFRFERVYLIVDDDLHAAGPGDGLPPAYRHKLIAYRQGALAALLAFVTHVVAPSEAILARYPDKTGLRLGPVQCHVPGGLGHHRVAGGLDIIIASTRSHIADITSLAPALAKFLRERPDARLTTFLGGVIPGPLRGLGNAVHLRALTWLGYRRFVAENRFHVALAPARHTAFNTARSWSKIHDHAGFGAAGLYPAQPPFEPTIADGQSGLLLPEAPEAWVAALHRLADRRPDVAALAAGGQALSRALGDPKRILDFWLKELDLDPERLADLRDA
jgi:hypothetical protein